MLLLALPHAACEACQKSIEKSRGKLVIKEAARAVSERDDRLLAEKMEALENANKEVGAGGEGGGMAKQGAVGSLELEKAVHTFTGQGWCQFDVGVHIWCLNIQPLCVNYLPMQLLLKHRVFLVL